MITIVLRIAQKYHLHWFQVVWIKYNWKLILSFIWVVLLFVTVHYRWRTIGTHPLDSVKRRVLQLLAIFLIGFSAFVPKKLCFSDFGAQCSLQIFFCKALGFPYSKKMLMCFRIWYLMWFLISSFSSIWAAIMHHHWSWIV